MLSTLDLLRQAYPGAIYLSFAEAATAAGCTPKTLQNKFSLGSLPIPSYLRFGRRVVRIDELAAYLESGKAIKPTAGGNSSQLKRRGPGRPSKREQIEARRACE